jgi:hypothetical protein
MSKNFVLEQLMESSKTGRELSEPMQFYCLHSAGYTLSVNHGKIMQMDGNAVRLGEKHATFAPLGGTKYGYLSTTDPEVALFLMNRVFNEKDIVTHETFLDVTTPAEVKIEQALQREITTRNNLAEYLRQKEDSEKSLNAALSSKDQELVALKEKLKAFEAAEASSKKSAKVVSTVAEETK